MTASNRLEWRTSLGDIAQKLVVAKDKEVRDGRYRPTDVQELADKLTVAELRQVSVELDEELERLGLFIARIDELKTRLKEVAAI